MQTCNCQHCANPEKPVLAVEWILHFISHFGVPNKTTLDIIVTFSFFQNFGANVQTVTNCLHETTYGYFRLNLLAFWIQIRCLGLQPIMQKKICTMNEYLCRIDNEPAIDFILHMKNKNFSLQPKQNANYVKNL